MTDKKVLIVIKAYPEKSKKYGACVCAAGITENGEMIRLYPMPFELFRGGKNIPKYSWISVDCEHAHEYLNRKESYHIKPDSIRIHNKIETGPNKTWGERNNLVLPLKSKSIEDLVEQSKNDRTSLGLIRPKELIDLTIDTKGGVDDQENEIIQDNKNNKAYQETLFGEKRSDLELINYNFRYHFTCENPDCRGHNIMCEDWEMSQAWRKWEKRYSDKATLIEKFRKKFFYDMKNKNLHFFVGTHSRFNTWLIIGLYYPPL